MSSAPTLEAVVGVPWEDILIRRADDGMFYLDFDRPSKSVLKAIKLRKNLVANR